MLSIAERVGATPPGPTPQGLRPMFLPITLAEVSEATSIQVLLAKKLYLPTIKRVGLSAAYLMARDAIKAYTNTGDLAAVIAGASLSLHVFEAPYSAIESEGIDSEIVETSTVILIGPTVLAPLADLIDGVKEAFKLKVNADPNKVVKDLKEVYNKLKDLSDKAQTFADAINPKNFQANSVERGCLFSSSPSCSTLLFESGFQSVYVCPESTFCPPQPILVFVWNHVGGGLAVESPAFFPTFESEGD
jgi:hypothetical protein